MTFPITTYCSTGSDLKSNISISLTVQARHQHLTSSYVHSNDLPTVSRLQVRDRQHRILPSTPCELSSGMLKIQSIARVTQIHTVIPDLRKGGDRSVVRALVVKYEQVRYRAVVVRSSEPLPDDLSASPISSALSRVIALLGCFLINDMNRIPSA